MTYKWRTETGQPPTLTGTAFHRHGDEPLAVLSLSAHNALSAKGFVVVIAMAFGFILVPLFAVLGSMVLWGLLPFCMVALAGLWWGLKRSWADRDLSETLSIWTDRTELIHRKARKAPKTWTANTYWVATHVHAHRGPHRYYITMTGGADGREVELGSFLTEDERKALYPELREVLHHAAASAIPL